MEKIRNRITVKPILEEMDSTEDSNIVTKCENTLACMFAQPLMFIFAIVSFISRFGESKIENLVLDSVVFLILGVAFEVILRLNRKAKAYTPLIAILFSIWFLFVFIRFKYIMGPMVWMAAFTQIILSMLRIKRDMYVLVIATIFFTSLYIFLFEPTYEYQFSRTYYGLQVLAIIILMMLIEVVYDINIRRNRKILKHLSTVLEQKQEITHLYEELTQGEEELRQQNEKLQEYNMQIMQNEKKLKYIAYYDSLTNLPNRKYVNERLEEILIKAKAHNRPLYVVFIDIDFFKNINDTMGHQAGDSFIYGVATRMKNVISEEDILGRMGGDEFALLIPRNIKEEEVLEYLEHIRDRFSESFMIQNNLIQTTASFGVAMFPKHGEDMGTLMKNADVAMYKAKELGKNKIQIYKQDMQSEMMRRIEMEKSLYNGMENDEFYLLYQPQFNIEDNSIIGMEALLRWNSPTMGMVSPAHFIPYAEKSGLIIQLGEWVLRTACITIKRLQRKYNTNTIMSVNISSIQMSDKNFLKIVKSALKESELSPKYLKLEITESVLIQGIDEITVILNELRDMGVKISLDDFGKEYSSLSYLSRLPVTELKIDQIFIRELHKQVQNCKIVNGIISLAHNLEIAVVAEGVEYKEQLDYLKMNGCDIVQGYFLGKPMKEESLALLL